VRLLPSDPGGGGRLAIPYRFLLLLTPHPSLSRPFPSLSSHHGIMAKRSRAIKLPKGSGAEPGRQTTFKIGLFLVLWKCRLLSQLCEHQLPKASSCVHQYFCMNVRVTVLTWICSVLCVYCLLWRLIILIYQAWYSSRFSLMSLFNCCCCCSCSLTTHSTLVICVGGVKSYIKTVFCALSLKITGIFRNRNMTNYSVSQLVDTES